MVMTSTESKTNKNISSSFVFTAIIGKIKQNNLPGKVLRQKPEKVYMEVTLNHTSGFKSKRSGNV